MGEGGSCGCEEHMGRVQDGWIDEVEGRSEEQQGREGAGRFKGEIAMWRRWEMPEEEAS